MSIIEELQRIHAASPNLDFADIICLYGDKYQTDYNPYSHSDKDLYERLKKITNKDIKSYVGGGPISPYGGQYF